MFGRRQRYGVSHWAETPSWIESALPHSAPYCYSGQKTDVFFYFENRNESEWACRAKTICCEHEGKVKYSWFEFERQNIQTEIFFLFLVCWQFKGLVKPLWKLALSGEGQTSPFFSSPFYSLLYSSCIHPSFLPQTVLLIKEPLPEAAAPILWTLQ